MTKQLINYISSLQIASSLNNSVASLTVLNNLSFTYYRQGQDLLFSAQKAADFDESRQQEQIEQSNKMLQEALANAQKALDLANASPHSLFKSSSLA